MATSIEEAREELEAEYRKVREDLEEVRMAMIAVDQAGPEDDLYDRLDALEKAAGNVHRRPHRVRRQRTPQGVRALPGALGSLTRPPSPRHGHAEGTLSSEVLTLARHRFPPSLSAS